MNLSSLLHDVGRPIAYYPSLVKPLGGVNETLFLSQLIYWTGKQKDEQGWIYKDMTVLEEETGLSKKEQRTVRRKLKEIGVLEERTNRWEHKIYYRVNLNVLNTLWEQHRPSLPESVGSNSNSLSSSNQTALSETPNGNFEKSAKRTSRSSQTTLRYKETETTTEITQRLRHADATHQARLRASKVELMDDELVMAYRNKFKLTPSLKNRRKISQRVKDSAIWNLALEYWESKNYDPLNIADLLDHYEKRLARHPAVATGRSYETASERNVRRTLENASLLNYTAADYIRDYGINEYIREYGEDEHARLYIDSDLATSNPPLLEASRELSSLQRDNPLSKQQLMIKRNPDMDDIRAVALEGLRKLKAIRPNKGLNTGD